MTATSGTLEERTLIKALSDDDPSTHRVVHRQPLRARHAPGRGVHRGQLGPDR